MKLPQDNERHLAYVRGLPCCVCGTEEGSDPHHTKKNWVPVSYGGMSQKGSDYCAIPLCRACHSSYHTDGTMSFETNNAVSIDRLIVATLVSRIIALEAPEHEQKFADKARETFAFVAFQLQNSTNLPEQFRDEVARILGHYEGKACR